MPLYNHHPVIRLGGLNFTSCCNKNIRGKTLFGVRGYFFKIKNRLFGQRFFFVVVVAVFPFFFSSSNPCVKGWLSINRIKGATLLRTKSRPRSRSSTNGLAPGCPWTWGAWWARGQSPFWPCPTENFWFLKLNSTYFCYCT